MASWSGEKFIQVAAGQNGLSVCFKPSAQQLAFRELAVAMANEGKFFHRDWLQASRAEGFHMEPVTKVMWEEWQEMPGFTDWFYSALPDLSTLNEQDMRWLEVKYWESIRDGLLRGESWAAKEFANRRWVVGQKGPGGGISIPQEIADFLQSGTGSVWKASKASTEEA